MGQEFQVTFVDYSEQYYAGMEKTSLPVKMSGKFLQIRNQSREYLLFSPKEYAPYHADIVKQFCKEKGLVGSYDGSGKRFNIHDPAWVVAGGGRFERDATRKWLRLFDDSMAYGKFDPNGLKEKILLIKEFADYEVTVE